MSSRLVRIDCPSCGDEVVAEADSEFDDERLTGQETECDGCGNPVGVYCY